MPGKVEITTPNKSGLSVAFGANDTEAQEVVDGFAYQHGYKDKVEDEE